MNQPASLRDHLRQMLALLEGERQALAALDMERIITCADGKMELCAVIERCGKSELDEECHGLLDAVKRLNEGEGVSFLLAEQNTNVALRYARYGYILENGRVVLDGDAAKLRENEDVKEFYLGLSASGRKSYRDVKHYKRRKRWL